MTVEHMLVTEPLRKLVSRYVKVSILCMGIGFAGGYYTAYHKPDFDESNYQIVYDNQQKKFFVPKEYMVPYEDNQQKKDQLIYEIFDKKIPAETVKL
ncbi:MAG: hypothetical protein KAS15_07555 [Nanoarchaeota archaeon]|nr:hypothetical protein [Nanoarchaeota archaeon]MCK5630530.1 hypothetical protein [Nanoarchaeota archaeon]